MSTIGSDHDYCGYGGADDDDGDDVTANMDNQLV